MVGYFNGVHRAKSEVFLNLRKSVYLVQGPQPGEMLDIPEQFQDWNNYQASTGHLINHSPEGNIIYMECQHPRFGHILCVVTTKDIKEGQELFVTVRNIFIKTTKYFMKYFFCSTTWLWTRPD